MLKGQLQKDIDLEAKAEAKKLTARVPIFRHGYEAGWYDAGEKYAALWQATEVKAARYEKALKAILNTNHDNYERVILKVKSLATAALTPKTGEDELHTKP